MSSITGFEEVEEVLTDIMDVVASKLFVWNKGMGSASTVTIPKEVEAEDLGKLVDLIFKEESKEDLVKEVWEIVSFDGEVTFIVELTLVFVETSQALFIFFTDLCLESLEFSAFNELALCFRFFTLFSRFTHFCSTLYISLSFFFYGFVLLFQFFLLVFNFNIEILLYNFESINFMLTILK